MEKLFYYEQELPKTLSNLETCELFKMLKNGDKMALKKLAEHNIRLVVNEVLKKFNSSNYDKNELVAIGNIGLINAIKTFDVTKGCKFSTYATRCIDNEILMFLRKTKKFENEYSVYNIIKNVSDEENITFIEAISDDVDIVDDYEKLEKYKILNSIIDSLKDRDKEIIKLYFGFYNGVMYTQSEISKKFNITQSLVSRVIKSNLNKIKDIYMQYENLENNNRVENNSNKDELEKIIIYK